MKKWIIYGSVVIVSLLVLVTIVGVIFEMMSRSRAAREFSTAGQTGGYRRTADTT